MHLSPNLFSPFSLPGRRRRKDGRGEEKRRQDDQSGCGQRLYLRKLAFQLKNEIKCFNFSFVVICNQFGNTLVLISFLSMPLLALLFPFSLGGGVSSSSSSFPFGSNSLIFSSLWSLPRHLADKTGGARGGHRELCWAGGGGQQRIRLARTASCRDTKLVLVQ